MAATVPFEQVEAALEAMTAYVARVDDLRGTQLRQIHDETAELRDELLALANRMESLTRAFRQTVTNPGDAA